MDKPKRSTRFLNRLNLQRRKYFDFDVSLSLEECKERLLALDTRESYPPTTWVRKVTDGTEDFHYRMDTDGNPTILDVYFQPIDLNQTQVYGNVRMKDVVVGVFVVSMLVFIGMGVGVSVIVASPVPLLFPVLALLNWGKVLLERKRLLDQMMVVLGMKLKNQ
jgi:hypothetical protein